MESITIFMTKPSNLDMVCWLIKRKDNANEQLEIARQEGNVGQQVYWHTIAVDAGLLLGWVCDDEHWTLLARQDANGLQSEVDKLDKMFSPTLIKAA